jgi:ubiquinone/menaquinone biosynthesis C-methylase UbiE
VGGAGVSAPAPLPEPGRAEVWASRLTMNGLLGPLYGRYVAQMGLRGDERVLDYGSGSGGAARHLAPRLEARGGQLTCMDVSARWQAAIRRVLSGHSNVEFLLGDVREMGLPAASFDVVLAHWMLHDLPPWDRPQIVAELARLLRPGGRLFSREPTAARHGMPAAQARELFAAAGLTETLATEGKGLILGEHYRAVWTKPAADSVREKAGALAGFPNLHLSGARQRPLLTPDQVSP